MRDEDSGVPLDDDEALVTAYVSGELAGAARRAFEDRLVSDAALADAVYAHQGIDEWVRSAHRAATAVAAPPIRRLPRWRSRSFVWAAAASVVLAAGGWQAWEFRHPPRRLRGDLSPCRAISPAGTVAHIPRRFLWTRDPRATSYRFAVLDSGMRVLSEVVVTDTFAVAPPAVPADGWWKLTPLRDGLEVSGSIVTEFHVAR